MVNSDYGTTYTFTSSNGNPRFLSQRRGEAFIVKLKALIGLHSKTERESYN